MNIMSTFVFYELKLFDLQNYGIAIQLADHSLTNPLRVVKDVTVNIDDFLFPVVFYVMNVNEHTSSSWNSVLLGRPFLKTAKAKIDVGEGSLSIECCGQTKNFLIDDDDPFTKSIFLQ